MSANYYEALGVDKTASGDEIKKAFRNLARKEHPDKGGSKEKFQLISQAYEILIDPEKRKQYDYRLEHGFDGGDGENPGFAGNQPRTFFFSSRNGGPGEFFFSSNGAGSFEDIFSSFFGEEFPNQARRGPASASASGAGGRTRRNSSAGQEIPPKVFQMEVTLEELYKGAIKEATIERKVVCEGCKGTGVYPPCEPSTCTACSGSGRRVMVREIMPGFVQRFAEVCKGCGGKGYVRKTKDGKEPESCSPCRGAGLVIGESVLEIKVRPGMRDGEQILIEKKGDQLPGKSLKENSISGEVIVVLREKSHPVFTRIDDDLKIQVEIPLVEALTGYTFTTQRLDKSKLQKTFEQVIKPGDIIRIPNEGMPRSDGGKGNLLVHVSIKFPDTISNAKKSILKSLLEDPAAEPSSSSSSPSFAPGKDAPFPNASPSSPSFSANASPKPSYFSFFTSSSSTASPSSNSNNNPSITKSSTSSSSSSSSSSKPKTDQHASESRGIGGMFDKTKKFFRRTFNSNL